MSALTEPSEAGTQGSGRDRGLVLDLGENGLDQRVRIMRSRLEEPRQRSARERGLRAMSQPEQINDGGGQLAEVDRLGDDAAIRHRRRREDQERHVQLAAVKTEAVPREPALLKVLAVVGGDDDQGVFKQPPAPQLIEEAADLVVEIGDAAVVTINQDIDRLPLKSRSLRVRDSRTFFLLVKLTRSLEHLDLF